MALYNMTQLQAATTVNKLFVYANDTTGGVMMGLFMIAVFFVMLMALLKWGFQDALLVSGFVCFILSSILAYGGLLIIIYPILFLVLTALTALFSMVVQRK